MAQENGIDKAHEEIKKLLDGKSVEVTINLNNTDNQGNLTFNVSGVSDAESNSFHRLMGATSGTPLKTTDVNYSVEKQLLTIKLSFSFTPNQIQHYLIGLVNSLKGMKGISINIGQASTVG
ncbi:hypothetical protein C4569_02335 [Candidatus Parcubacteria bacterium]|nr:MAG: hypothetical protein C4569_02335 [Candidatus Parcubacteria bacterium]